MKKSEGLVASPGQVVLSSRVLGIWITGLVDGVGTETGILGAASTGAHSISETESSELTMERERFMVVPPEQSSAHAGNSVDDCSTIDQAA
ncbi:hypothetical protein GCM10008957_36030 [Deinococcus ruber]|uniref:Uncharacterized protein n=1 Tax=Deinococcus ruber TaxID=1848197 RepID=A0A918F8X3_9DEIO|nr:hypothetical protein GCM10008957_36030 [Deinococcus ruber]